MACVPGPPCRCVTFCLAFKVFKEIVFLNFVDKILQSGEFIQTSKFPVSLEKSIATRGTQSPHGGANVAPFNGPIVHWKGGGCLTDFLFLRMPRCLSSECALTFPIAQVFKVIYDLGMQTIHLFRLFCQVQSHFGMSLLSCFEKF